PFRFSDTALEPLAWGDLDGWTQDNHSEAFATFRASCRAVVGHARWGDDPRPLLPVLADICRKALAAPPSANARSFFEENFRPVPHLQTRRPRGVLDRLLRADCGRLTVPNAGVHGARLPATGRSRSTARLSKRSGVSQQRPRHPPAARRDARTLLRPR